MSVKTKAAAAATDASLAANLAALASIHLAEKSSDRHTETTPPNHQNFDPADLYYSLLDLHHLTKQVGEVLFDMDYGTGEGRNHTLDRVAALCRVVSDQVERLADRASIFDYPGGEWRSPFD